MPQRGDRRKSESDRRSYFGLSRFFIILSVTSSTRGSFVSSAGYVDPFTGRPNIPWKRNVHFLFVLGCEGIPTFYSLGIIFDSLLVLLDAINHSAVYINPLFSSIQYNFYNSEFQLRQLLKKSRLIKICLFFCEKWNY